MEKLSEAGSSYGASMGRSGNAVDTEFPVVFEIERLEWVDGAYDQAGAYWGRSDNDYIYRAVGESADAVEEMFIRAKTLSEAKATLIETYPNASIASSANVEVLTAAYLEAALWSTTNERYHDNPEDEAENLNETEYEVAEEMRAHFAVECESFYSKAEHLLSEAEAIHGYSIDQAGYDFWMTQNGHGVGFEDRDLGNLGEELAKIAKTFSTDDVYVGDDDLIHSSHEYRTSAKFAPEEVSTSPTP